MMLAVAFGTGGSVILAFIWYRIFRSGLIASDFDFRAVTLVCAAYCWFATSMMLWLGIGMSAL